MASFEAVVRRGAAGRRDWLLIEHDAGTAATPKLAELAGLADRQAWRVVLVGDPRQFSAVGRGGMFAHLIDMYGGIELDQVHRFRHYWERQASLRLRSGDPAVLTDYERRGRLHGGTHEEMEAGIIAAWEHARVRGDAVALMANSTDAVGRLNRLAQYTRIKLGELDADSTAMRVGEGLMLVGDEVVTRRNDRRLLTDRGLMVKNRDHWTVTAIHPDSVTVTGRTGTIRLPVERAMRLTPRSHGGSWRGTFEVLQKWLLATGEAWKEP